MRLLPAVALFVMIVVQECSAMDAMVGAPVPTSAEAEDDVTGEGLPEDEEDDGAEDTAATGCVARTLQDGFLEKYPGRLGKRELASVEAHIPGPAGLPPKLWTMKNVCDYAFAYHEPATLNKFLTLVSVAGFETDPASEYVIRGLKDGDASMTPDGLGFNMIAALENMNEYLNQILPGDECKNTRKRARKNISKLKNRLSNIFDRMWLKGSGGSYTQPDDTQFLQLIEPVVGAMDCSADGWLRAPKNPRGNGARDLVRKLLGNFKNFSYDKARDVLFCGRTTIERFGMTLNSEVKLGAETFFKSCDSLIERHCAKDDGNFSQYAIPICEAIRKGVYEADSPTALTEHNLQVGLNAAGIRVA